MSGLIKASQADGYRRIAVDSVPEVTDAAGTAERVGSPTPRDEVAILRETIATLEAAQLGHIEAIAAARREGEAHGRREAMQEFDIDRSEALDRLETACNRALELFARHIVDAEALAVLIAEVALERMLLDEPHYRDLLKAAIVARIREIDQSGIVRVVVSSSDFPDQTELDDLAALCDVDQLAIGHTRALKAGECRIDLTLGTLDVGLRQQWEKLKAAFRPAIAPDGHA